MSSETISSVAIISAKQDRKVFRPKRKSASGVPVEISEDPKLLKAMDVLPGNYNFEIPKTIWRIKKTKSKCVCLQFPEGLLLYSLTIADILEDFTGVNVIILGDVTYGACCIDDFTARALEADLMVHYGHSCLIPVNVTKGINMLYVFVDIKMDTLHLLQTIEKNFDKNTKIALLSTIQFVTTLQHLAPELKESGYSVQIPQSKPLSPGEVLGCTSPTIKDADCIVFIGDGRFHLESAMMANPSLKFYRYNPYDKTMTQEYHDYQKMVSLRKQAVDVSARGETIGLILGTLGRQGSPKVMDRIEELLKKCGKNHIKVLLSEIFPEKLKLFRNVDAWVQIACPRLSIDWGYAFDKPVLTPYEAIVAFKEIKWQKNYPMDYYSSKSLGDWTPNHIEVSSPIEKSCNSCQNCECDK